MYTIRSKCEKATKKQNKKTTTKGYIKQHKIHIVGNIRDKDQNKFSTGNHFL